MERKLGLCDDWKCSALLGLLAEAKIRVKGLRALMCQAVPEVLVNPHDSILKCFIQNAYLVAQTGKNPLAMPESLVRSLSQEDPLEESMATLSSILAWRIPQDREATVHGVAKSLTPLRAEAHTSRTEE